jgi:glycosyltransferase involved in cell wall biosynthesis
MIPIDKTIMLVLLSLFGTAASIQLFYWLYFYLAPILYKSSGKKGSNEPVSVIICARNEAANLKKYLPSVLEQDYPSYEVIVVNDCSEDNTYEVLGELIASYPHLKVSSINKDPKFTHNKKFAQFIGIKAASNEILIFTDADCQPESDKWLSLISSNFDEKTDITLGYGGYIKEKGLLNMYIRFDSMFIAVQYIGMAIKGIPYMGVGRNLAYRRSLFFRSKGFGTHYHIISGDDDLFVNSVASKANTCIELRGGSFTRSVPSITTSEFIKQKKRHFTTAKFYKPWHILLLFLEPFSRLLFYFLFAFLVSLSPLWPYILAVFLSRLCIQTVVFALAQKKFNENKLVIPALFFDIFSPIVNMVLYFSSLSNISGKNRWK